MRAAGLFCADSVSRRDALMLGVVSLHNAGHRAPLSRDGLNGGSAREDAAAGARPDR